jgi:hypothetical protein
MPPSILNQVSVTSGAGGGNRNITVPPNANRMIVVCYTGKANAAGADPAINTLTLTSTGLSFTRLKTITNTWGGFKFVSEIWYYLNPTPGADNVAWTPVSNSASGMWIATAVGVNLTTPWRDAGGGATGVGGAATFNQPSMANDLVVDSIQGNGAAALGVGAGQVAFGAQYALTSSRGNASYEVGASPTVTMSWTIAPGDDWLICTGSITPYLEFRSRAFKYIIDIVQNPPEILDEKGARVHPSEVESDCWIFLRDKDSPTVIQTDTFIDDDRMFYAEEVTYDEESDKLSIRNNRQQLMDVILARKGSGGLL